MFENDTDKFDQHFLVDQKMIFKFLATANIDKNDVVVEIGPGKGQITRQIARQAKKVICIELDQRLKPYLNMVQKECDNIEIIYGNVLDTYIPTCNKIVTSLPYSIIEPFINKLLKCQFEEIIMITGKKYAEAVVTKKVNKLSLLTNCFFNAKYILDIPPECFNPSPRVMSSIIKLKPKSEYDIEDDKELIFRFMFYFQDKKIKNALVEVFIRSFEIRNEKITQRTVRKLISDFCDDASLLEKKFMNCSNKELQQIDILIDEMIKKKFLERVKSKTL